MEPAEIMLSLQTENFNSKMPIKGVIGATTFVAPEGVNDYNGLKALVISQRPDILKEIEAEQKRHSDSIKQIMSIPDDITLRKELKAEYLRNRKALYEQGQMIYGAISSDSIDGVDVVETSENNNLLTRGFYEELYAIMAGSLTTPSVNQTMFIEYLAIGTMSGDTDFDDSQLGNEIFRAVPSSIQDDGVRSLYATAYLGPSDGNPDFTQVDSSTSTVITVDDATGFIVGAKLRVETTNNTYTCIVTNVSGVNITVGSITGGALLNAGAFDAGDIPQNGDYVYILVTELGAFVGGAATASADTGNMIDRSQGAVHMYFPLSKLVNLVLSGDSVQ